MRTKAQKTPVPEVPCLATFIEEKEDYIVENSETDVACGFLNWARLFYSVAREKNIVVVSMTTNEYDIAFLL